MDDGRTQATTVQQAGFSQCGHCQGRMDLRSDGRALFLACPACNEVRRGAAAATGGFVYIYDSESFHPPKLTDPFPNRSTQPQTPKTHALPRRGPYTAAPHAPAHLCPLCQFEAILITPDEDPPNDEQRGPQRPYSICPWCFHHPPDFARVDDEFRCAFFAALLGCTVL